MTPSPETLVLLAVLAPFAGAFAIPLFRAQPNLRETKELESQGRIPGAIHAPRGLLEFHADPESPLHKPELSSGKRLVVYCASGGRSALGAKTLKDMGIDNVANMLGGFTGWKEAGGEIERG